MHACNFNPDKVFEVSGLSLSTCVSDGIMFFIRVFSTGKVQARQTIRSYMGGVENYSSIRMIHW